MAMLAEPRKRNKWVPGSSVRGNLWSSDDNKLGQKMLEQMGWSKGKGLGKQEQGDTEHVSVKMKADTRGMGYQGIKDDGWIQHYDNFEGILANLNKHNASSSETPDATIKPAASVGNDKKIDKSLEKKSKSSKARVHYHKFTRGKDVSRYTADDLACVLGSKKSKGTASKPTSESSGEDESSKQDEEKGEEHNEHGVVTIHGGSVQDYFAKKMADRKIKTFGLGVVGAATSSLEEADSAPLMKSNTLYSRFTKSNSTEMKSLHKPEDVLILEEKLNGSDDELLTVERNILSEIDEAKNSRKSKKKRKRESQVSELNSDCDKKKKKKKKKNERNLCELAMHDDSENDVDPDALNVENLKQDVEQEIEILEETKSTKKKKKKSKKENLNKAVEESEEMEIEILETTKSTKRNKSKKEKSAEKVNRAVEEKEERPDSNDITDTVCKKKKKKKKDRDQRQSENCDSKTRTTSSVTEQAEEFNNSECRDDIKKSEEDLISNEIIELSNEEENVLVEDSSSRLKPKGNRRIGYGGKEYVYKKWKKKAKRHAATSFPGADFSSVKGYEETFKEKKT